MNSQKFSAVSKFAGAIALVTLFGAHVSLAQAPNEIRPDAPANTTDVQTNTDPQRLPNRNVPLINEDTQGSSGAGWFGLLGLLGLGGLFYKKEAYVVEPHHTEHRRVG